LSRTVRRQGSTRILTVVTSWRSELAELPLVPRFALIGCAAAATVGGLLGLVLGLIAHPPTAWFAVVEVAVPAGICGAALGALTGVVMRTVHAINHH
jgi:hypothetical protein